MHVPTHNFADIEGNIEDIQKRIIDALFHVRDTGGVESFLVSVFLPDAQCHVLVEIDDDVDHRCHLTVVKQTPGSAEVSNRLAAEEFEQTVQYLKHIVLEFDRERAVSNLLITTDGRRLQDVTSKLHRFETDHPEQ